MKEGNKFYNSTLILNSFHKSPAIEDEDHKIRYDALNHLYQYFQTDEYETYLKQSKATPPTKELLLREKDQIWLFFLDPMNRRVCFEDKPEKYTQVDTLDSDAPNPEPVVRHKLSILSGLNRDQIIIALVQIFMIYFVGLVFHGDSLNFFDKIMIIFGGTIPLIMISEPNLATHPQIGKYLLYAFIFSDAFIIQSLSDAKEIKGLSAELLFFAAYAIKSIHFVNNHFFKSKYIDRFAQQAIELSEVNTSLIYIVLVLLFANYGDFDLIWAALVLQFIGVFHWMAWFGEEKNPLLEAIVGYAFLISDAYLLGVTCQLGWFLELFLFISFVPRILTLLRYHDPFRYLRDLISQYIAIFYAFSVKYHLFAAAVGFMCTPCMIAIIDTELFEFMKHSFLLNFFITIEMIMVIFLNIWPYIGRSDPWNKYGIMAFTLCQTYIMTYIVALYSKAGFFIGLFLTFSIGKNVLFLKKKFLGRPLQTPFFAGFNFTGGMLVLFEGGMILLVSFLSYSGQSLFTHYNYLLTSFIINVFIMLQLLLAPDVSTQKPLCYILGAAYLVAEAYSLGALSHLIWIQSESMWRGLSIAGFIYSSIEKTRIYADVLEPLPIRIGFYNDDEEFNTTEYKEAFPNFQQKEDQFESISSN